MQLRHRTETITPDESIVWRRRQIGGSVLYLADDAPELTQEWLSQPSAAIGTFLAKGQMFGHVYQVDEDPAFALKESYRNYRAKFTEERWSRYCGLDALRMNVGMQAGINRIGSRALLPEGTRITTPQYFGLLVGDEVFRLLMSFEAGTQAAKNSTSIGSDDERRAIHDAAMLSVGFDPTTIYSYDDKPENYLIRTATTGFEAVRVDVCNWPRPGQVTC